jgi:hypothetical protein
MKQNFFADMEDSLLDGEDGGFEAIAILAGLVLFAGVWIVGGSFWFALIAAALLGPTLGGLVALFLSCLAMMFARHEEGLAEPEKFPRLARFLFALPGLLLSGSLLYALYLII